MFAPLRRLQKLFIGSNNFETISSEILESLSGVTELNIDNNRLTFLPEVNISFPNLQRVAIEGNPWQCPCYEELTKWLANNNVEYIRMHSSFYSGHKPLCVATSSNYCIRDLKTVQKYEIEDHFDTAIETYQE